MKQYKLLKDLPFTPKGTIFDEHGKTPDGTTKSNIKTMIEDQESDKLKGKWFEEINKPEPKFKIGDYVIKDDRVKIADGFTGKLIFIKIHTLRFDDYLKCFMYNGNKEENLLEPTQEELEKYFR